MVVGAEDMAPITLGADWMLELLFVGSLAAIVAVLDKEDWSYALEVEPVVELFIDCTTRFS